MTEYNDRMCEKCEEKETCEDYRNGIERGCIPFGCSMPIESVGEWIPNKGNGYSNPGRHCSLCGKNVEFSEPVCPGCGAQMKIGGEEENG